LQEQEKYSWDLFVSLARFRRRPSYEMGNIEAAVLGAIASVHTSYALTSSFFSPSAAPVHLGGKPTFSTHSPWILFS
jgi:hypothetical protein